MRVVDEDVRIDGVERLRHRRVARGIRPRDTRHELQVNRRVDGAGDGTTGPAGDAGHADPDHDTYIPRNQSYR